MRIIHVISGLTKGGGERMAVELANKAVENGDEVTILAAWPEDPIYLQNKVHPDVSVRFVASRKKNTYLKIIPFLLSNRKWICSHDVLHCHLTFGSVFASMVNILLKKMARNKKPVIVETNHAVGMPVPAFNRWLHSRMSLQADGMVLMAKDPYWNSFTVQHPSLKTAIIPNGISEVRSIKDPQQKNHFTMAAGIAVNYKYLIGTISMLRADRNPLLYVPLFDAIHKVLGNEVHFVLGGSGDEKDKIENLVAEKGLSDHFHLLGLVNEPAPVISNLDVYVSVSVGETAGISMIEAAMCKTPVVSIQLTQNYQRKDTDWVWSSTDVNELARQIIFLLQNKEACNRLAEKQYNYVMGHFTSEAMYNAYNSFYKELLNSPAARFKKAD